MAEGDKTSKKAAHDDDVGLIHALVTKGFRMKLNHQIDTATEEIVKHKKKKKKGKAVEDEDPTFELDLKTLEAAGRWCAYNKMTSRGIEEDSLTQEHSELKRIRDKQRGRICTPSSEH